MRLDESVRTLMREQSDEFIMSLPGHGQSVCLLPGRRRLRVVLKRRINAVGAFRPMIGQKIPAKFSDFPAHLNLFLFLPIGFIGHKT